MAILSFHSHGDRSFLDDQRLALLSGDLRAQGVENDLVVAVLRPGSEGEAVERRLWERLEGYDIIVYERVWSAELVVRGRARLPGRTFISCEGEHALADPPADYVCSGDIRVTVPALLARLRGEAAPPAPARFAPNLQPVVVNPEDLPAFRTFSVTGNAGCPYQADARQNPLYAGIEMPDGVGRGCAFCTTGNFYEAHPPHETAASVLEQIRYVRREAPGLAHLVLKDQNPFAYLRDVIRGSAAEGLAPFTLLLETRADWFLRSESRFEEALELAAASGLSLAPYLVGIENFSQPELDRFNKGVSAETNVRFLESLWRWKDTYGPGLVLDHAAFGFVLFTPWTTVADLEANWHGIERTRFDRLRGNVLLSRARLYPDTALYYLAERDGLLTGAYDNPAADSSLRYGYYPACPWRFQRPEVARFAEVATEAVARTGGSDELRLFRSLLDAFARGGDVTLDAVLGAGRDRPSPATAEMRRRLAALLHPLDLDGFFAGGWRFANVSVAPGSLRVQLTHEREAPIEVEIAPRGAGASYAVSRLYEIRSGCPSLTATQRQAMDAICRALRANDR